MTLARNVATIARPPKVEQGEVEILTAEQIALVLEKLQGHQLYPIAALALATGTRRGELLGLHLGDLDLDAATLRVERSLEETKAGLRFKAPKTKHGRRTISLPPSAVQILRAHRVKQLEQRMALGLGRADPSALVFSKLDGSPMSPDNLSRESGRVCRRLGLPRVMFHALRHSHASALIAAGLDVVTMTAPGARQSDRDAQHLCAHFPQDRHRRGGCDRGACGERAGERRGKPAVPIRCQLGVSRRKAPC